MGGPLQKPVTSVAASSSVRTEETWRAQYEKLPNDQLVLIAYVRSDDYVRDAVQAARALLDERGQTRGQLEQDGVLTHVENALQAALRPMSVGLRLSCLVFFPLSLAFPFSVPPHQRKQCWWWVGGGAVSFALVASRYL